MTYSGDLVSLPHHKWQRGGRGQVLKWVGSPKRCPLTFNGCSSSCWTHKSGYRKIFFFWTLTLTMNTYRWTVNSNLNQIKMVWDQVIGKVAFFFFPVGWELCDGSRALDSPWSLQPILSRRPEGDLKVPKRLHRCKSSQRIVITRNQAFDGQKIHNLQGKQDFKHTTGVQYHSE